MKSLCSFLYKLSNITKLEFPKEKKSVARKKNWKNLKSPPKNKQNGILEKWIYITSFSGIMFNLHFCISSIFNPCSFIQLWGFNNILWTHSFSLHPFSNPWKHQKTLRRYRKGALATNGLSYCHIFNFYLKVDFNCHINYGEFLGITRYRFTHFIYWLVI